MYAARCLEARRRPIDAGSDREPLHTYAADSGPGTANGQAVNANGGLWYVLSPSGNMITRTP